MKNMKNAIILCSGGLDSVVAGHYVKKSLKYGKLFVLFFDYGQRTLEQERKASKFCARELQAKFIEIKLPRIKEIAGDLLINKKNKKAKKLEIKDLKDSSKESKKWYVPQRNLIFLAYAISLAESLSLKKKGVWEIFVGFKNEGKESYPDTTKEFVSALNKVNSISGNKEIKILAPLIEKDKEDIILLGKKLGVSLGKTFSCYVGSKRGEKHCGTCLACRLRQAGFYWANVKDETRYAER